MTRTDLLQLCLRLGLTPIPLKLCSKEPLVRWGKGWNPTASELWRWAAKPDINWGVRCGPELAVLDFDSLEAFRGFLEAHPEAASWPRVRTGRGFHLWVRPKRPVSTHRHDGLEVKGLGSYVVAPPSIHPDGTSYVFEVTLDDALPEVDLWELLGLSQIHSLPSATTCESIRQAVPSDFALRYGKSAWPQSMCGKATKVFTRSDGKMKKLLSLRCWKWDCPKCAPLLKRYWLEKLKGLPCRFILRLPTRDKPTKFLRRLGKPRYVHIVANGESWLFLMDGEAEPIWAEAHRAGYDLVAGDSTITVTPAGTDANTGEAIPGANITPDSVTVHQQLKAHLEVTITSPVGTETYSTCQHFDLTFTIDNSGEADALDVTATIDPGATAELEGQGQGVSRLIWASLMGSRSSKGSSPALSPISALAVQATASRTNCRRQRRGIEEMS